MTQEEITEIKIIAKFDGWEEWVTDGPIQLYKKGDTTKHIGDLKYNSDWNLLMPVVEKIKSINRIGLNAKEGESIINNLLISLMSVEIEKAYKAVIEFIRWYNLWNNW